MQSQQSNVDTKVPHVIAALMDDGEARVIWADDRKEALKLIGVIQSGILGAVVALCYGEAHEEHGRDETVESVLRRLQLGAVVN